MVTVPKTYKPPGGRAKEHLAYISAAEALLLKRATDGKSNMTDHGVPSFYMEGSFSGNWKDSKPSQTGTKTGTTTSNNNSGMGSGATTSQNSQGRYGEGNSMADIAARNAADVAKRASEMRESAKISTPNASGSPNNNPVNVNPFDSLRNAVMQRVAQIAMMEKKPEQARPAVVPAGQRVSAVFGPNFARDPSIMGRLNPPAAFQKDQSRIAPEIQRSPNYGEALQNALTEHAAKMRALNEARGNPNYSDLSPAPAPMTPEQQMARMQAVSRGPGAVAGVMPGAGPLAQDRTLQTLSGSMTDGGTPIDKGSLQKLAQTIAGEAGNQAPMGQTAVANTMLNRLALAEQNPKKFGYLGGKSIPKLMEQYDATGLAKRTGGIPNSAFKNARLGTDSLGEGIASLAGAASPYSQFGLNAPRTIKEATSFYNPATSNPKWGGEQFATLGDHVFGLPDELMGKGQLVSNARGVAPPTQVAGINPAVAPPQQSAQTTAQPIPQPMAPGAQMSDIPTPAPSGWLSGIIPDLSQTSIAQQFTDANKKINSVGGAKMAVALANLFMGDGQPAPDQNAIRNDKGGGGDEPKPVKVKHVKGGKKKKEEEKPETVSFQRRPLAPWPPPVFMNPEAPIWNRPWNA